MLYQKREKNWRVNMIRGLFFLLLTVLTPLCAHKDRGKLKYTQEIFPKNEQWVVDLIYDGLEAIDTLCREHSIEYMLTGGSLLGSYLYGGLITWDDDADLSMLEEDVKKFLKLEPELNDKGFLLSKSKWGYYIYPKNGLSAKKGKNYPSIDLFPIKLRNGKYRTANKNARRKWPKEYITVNEWKRITDVGFGHLKLRGHTGKDAIRMLNTSYGNDWKRVATSWWDHKNECFRKQVYVRLTEHIHAKRSEKKQPDPNT